MFTSCYIFNKYHNPRLQPLNLYIYNTYTQTMSWNPVTATWGQWGRRLRGSRSRWTKRFTGKQPREKRQNYRISRLESGVTGKELKTHDVADTAPCTAVADVILVNSIAQGVTSLTREGLTVNLVSVQLKYFLTSDVASAANDKNSRVMLVFDRHNNGVLPDVTGQILEDTDTLAFREHEFARRFIVVYDSRHVLGNKGTAASPIKNSISRSFYKKWKKPKKLRWQGAAAGIANCQGLTFFLVFFGDNAASPSTINYNLRIRFTG